jgi:hypothetical protein
LAARFFNQGGAIFSDTQYVDFSVRSNESRVSDILASRRQRSGEQYDILLKGWDRSTRDREAMAQGVPTRPRLAICSARPRAFFRVPPICGNLSLRGPSPARTSAIAE